MSYQDHAKVSEIRYAPASLSVDEPIKFQIEKKWTPVIDPDNVAYYTLFKPFNLSNFLSPRLPIDMGLYEDEGLHSHGVNVLRMPIKFPKSSTMMTSGNEFRIPKELAALVPVIKRTAEYESFINKDFEQTFCHITFDRSTVEPDTYHRFPGFHGDGIQGTKLTPKEIVEHSYILTTSPPTEFCLQPFFLKHLDEAKHNYFLEFDKQAMEENVYSSLPSHLYMIDPYMVHRTPRITEKAARIFMRITYAFTELQHPKNTLNPLFDGQMYDKRLDIRESLTRFDFDVPFPLYGLAPK